METSKRAQSTFSVSAEEGICGQSQDAIRLFRMRTRSSPVGRAVRTVQILEHTSRGIGGSGFSTGRRSGLTALEQPKIRSLVDVQVSELPRLDMGDQELNRVLGGGAVSGGVVLLGGEPGIGKSTLMLQVALQIGQKGAKVLYISGEESAEQVRMRANRLGNIAPSVLIFPQTQVPAILDALRAEDPAVVVVDSIQTLDHPDRMAFLDPWDKSENRPLH